MSIETDSDGDGHVLYYAVCDMCRSRGDGAYRTEVEARRAVSGGMSTQHFCPQCQDTMRRLVQSTVNSPSIVAQGTAAVDLDNIKLANLSGHDLFLAGQLVRAGGVIPIQPLPTGAAPIYDREPEPDPTAWERLGEDDFEFDD